MALSTDRRPENWKLPVSKSMKVSAVRRRRVDGHGTAGSDEPLSAICPRHTGLEETP